MAKTALMLDKLAPSAKILDGILILTLPDALRPIVWQMELGQTKSSAMEVREQQDGTFVLTLKTARQDVFDIAPYATRDGAVRALIAVSKAMEGAHGHLRAGAANTNFLPAVIPQTEPGRLKMTRIAVGLVLVLGLMFFLTRMDGAPGPSGLNPAAGEAAASSDVTGEPLSADDYLNAR
jgi:hypothetical protein